MSLPKYCRDCGEHFTELALEKGHDTEDGSLACDACGHKVWDNPIPVAVCVQPVFHTFEDGYTRHGLAIAKRAIEPRLGTWCLFAGHLKNGETVEEGSAREWNEETGLVAPDDDVRITRTYANGKGHLMIAVERAAIDLEDYAKTVLCAENSAFDVMWDEGMALGFPIHDDIAHRWFMEEKPSEFMMTPETHGEATKLLGYG